MGPIEVTHRQLVDESDLHPSPSCRVRGALTAKLVSPAGWSLWAVTAELAEGTTIEWFHDHGDEAVYVVEGSVEIEGGACPERGSFVVEAGVAATARALEPTRIVHFGPRDIEPPSDGF